MIFRITFSLVLPLAVLRAADLAPEPKLMDLNVIAIDNHGQPVNDLTSDDFQVTDAGKQQKIVFFRYNDSKLDRTLSLGPNEFSNRARAEIPHTTLILFDLMNESFSTRGVAANQMVRDLEGLEATDSLYLYFLTLDGRLVAIHGLPNAEGEVPQPAGVAWTRQIKPIMDQAMQAVTRVRPADIDVAVRVQLTYAALDQLAVQLSRVPGRKNIVWITDGVPIALGPGRSDTGDFVDFTKQMRQLSEGLDRSGVAIYPVRQVMLGSPDNIGATSGEANTGGAGTGVQSLATLDDFAGMTGGRPNAGKDIGSAVKQAMSDLRFSYQIGYFAPPQSRDGKFHKLRIVCKRKGVRVQAKTGYYAWPDPPGTAAKDAIDAAASTAFDAAEIGLRGTLVLDSKDGRTAHLKARIEAKDIAFGREGDEYTGELRLAVVSYLTNGRTEGSAVIPLDVQYSAQERERALKEGIDFSHDVAIGDQVTKVRLVVFDRDSNAIGSLTIPVSAVAPYQPR